MSERIRITFLPGRHTGLFPPNTNLWHAAQELAVEEIEAYCGGNGTCGKCRVRIEEGEFPITEADRKAFSDDELIEGYRLACQAIASQDCLIWTSRADEKDQTAILTEGLHQEFEIDPVVKKTATHVQPPELDENPFDLQKTLAAAGLQSVQLTLPAIQNLPETLRQHDFSITSVVANGMLLDFEGGNTLGQGYGVAVDLGTTTVVAKLLDYTGTVHAVVSRLNRQRAYGEDVISRIGHASNPEGLKTLQKAVIDLLNDMIAELLETVKGKREQIYEMVIAGNTVMEHLFLGIQPKYLAEMPYVPVFQRPPLVRAVELGLNIHPNGWIYCFPLLGRYVGGDTTAVVLSLLSRPKQETWLVVDIGTNGEIVLSRRGELSCCSTAAGPAFEGAQIRFGMRASQGAIERVFFTDGDLQVHTIGNQSAKGICGSGLIDAVGTFLQAGILDRTGRLLEDKDMDSKLTAALGSRLRGQDNDRRVYLTPAGKSEVFLNQRDIREIQLAKGAIATGIEVLLANAGLQLDDLDALYVAGAFGQYIRVDMALEIGLLPRISPDRIHFIGNAAYTGAEMALLSQTQRRLAEQIPDQIRYVEISADPEFQMRYAEQMFF